MKRAQVFFLIIFIIAHCHAQTADPIIQIAKNYFRSNPYNMSFSNFLNHLLNDPTLSNKTINKRTDTSFFFFKGDYNGHSPFNFKADRTEIRLAETEMDLEDSLSTTDTLLFYQLLGYSYGEEGGEAVKKEFSKFDRRYGKSFYSQDSDLKKGEEIVGFAKNYFMLTNLISPISIAWAKLDDFQNVFIITIRIKVIENTATLPIPPDSR
jgi:hypothetical protein